MVEVTGADLAASSSASGAPRRRFSTLVPLIAALAGGMALLWLGRGMSPPPWWVSFIYPAYFFVAAFRCLLTARRLESEERRAWVYFGLACASFGLAELAWGIHEAFLGDPLPSPSIADVGYFASPLFLIPALWFSRSHERTKWLNRIEIGNLGIIFSSILLMYVFLFYGFMQAPVPTLAAISGISYGILDLSVALFGFVILYTHFWSRKRLVITLILFALLANATTDLYYSYSLAEDGMYDSSGLMNLVYFLVAILFYWAAVERDALGPSAGADRLAPEIEERARQWETLLPPLAFAGVVVVAFLFREGLTVGMLPYVALASATFVISLGMRNWWGYRVETHARIQALASEARLQAANRELRSEMGAREQVEEELRQSEKMRALGHLTGGVAHDFNNLLSVIMGNLEIAEHSGQLDPSVREHLHEAREAANSGAALTKSLLALSRKQALRPESIDVGKLLNGMRSLLERSLGETIRIEIGEGETASYCLADRVQLEGVILNLAINARDAMADGGTLSIRASNITLDGKRVVESSEAGAETHVVIAIRDTGVGIPAEVLGKVFEPFFTTKDVGEGTGLGLSMAYGFAKQSGGHVEIDSAVGEGTEVRVHLPIAEAEAPFEALGVDGDTAGPRGRGESVLVVEDEAAVRKLVVAFLEELNYAVHTVEDGAEALIALESMASVDLLLSDVVLPGKLSGREVAREVRRRRPQVKVLLMSGYAEKVLNKDGPLEPNEAFLPKPFRKVDLARKVRSVLDSDAS